MKSFKTEKKVFVWNNITIATITKDRHIMRAIQLQRKTVKNITKGIHIISIVIIGPNLTQMHQNSTTTSQINRHMTTPCTISMLATTRKIF